VQISAQKSRKLCGEYPGGTSVLFLRMPRDQVGDGRDLPVTLNTIAEILEVISLI
jgi:hypothetical protein